MRRNTAKQPMSLVFDTRGEVKGTGTPACAPIARADRPQVADHDWLPVRPLQRALELVGVEVEGVDHAVPKISNQQIAGELAEALGRDRQSPRRVERPMRRDALDRK